MPQIGEPIIGLTAFVRSVELGSFSKAARLLGSTPSAVSKAVAKLEDRLCVRLLQRSTRALQLTSEGFILFERGSRILSEVQATEDELRETKGPRGRVRITAPLDLGRHWLMPLLPAFSARYPGVRLEVDLSDRFSDLVHDGFDVALRMGETAPSDTVRRKLGPTTSIVCAARSYLRKHGTPRKPSELAKHACLTYLREGGHYPWRIGDTVAEVNSVFAANNNDAILAMAIAGRGITRLPSFMVASAIADKRLVPLLTGYTTPGPFAYVLVPARRYVPPRVKALGDFLSEEFGKATL